MIEPPENPAKMGLESFWAVTLCRGQESGAPGEGTGAPGPPHGLWPHVSRIFIWLLMNSLCNNWQVHWVSKLASWVLWASGANQWNPRRRSWEPLYSHSGKKCRYQPRLATASEVGSEPLPCGTWHSRRVDSTRMEVNGGHQLVSEHRLLAEARHHAAHTHWDGY